MNRGISKIFGLFFLFIFLSLLVSAFSIDSGVTFKDGNFEYNSTASLIVNNISLTSSEFFLNDLPYCFFPNHDSYFITNRDCHAFKGMIPTTPGAEPFWTNGSNPTYECVNMTEGKVCNVLWYVNATGPIGETYEVFTIYSSLNFSSDACPDEDSTHLNITIVEPENEPPVVNLIYPQNNSVIDDTNFIFFNISVTDNQWLSNCTLWTNRLNSLWLPEVGESRDLNYLETRYSQNVSWNMSLADGIYTWNVYCCDYQNNCAFNATNYTFEVKTDIFQTFYGNISANVVLGRGNDTMYDFGAVNGSNIYVFDVDSNINFSSLMALTNSTDNIFAPDRFSELDTVFGYDRIINNIAKVYSENDDGSTPKYTQSYTVFDKVVPYVPYVNNSGSGTVFGTGILWDSSDDETYPIIPSGEGYYYDNVTQEDLVFISKVYTNSTGLYGKYDYEIKFPAKLKSYKGDQDLVEILLEIE